MSKGKALLVVGDTTETVDTLYPVCQLSASRRHVSVIHFPSIRFARALAMRMRCSN